MEKKDFDVYNSLSLTEYFGLVRVCCQNWRQELKDLIDNLPATLENKVAFVVVGSDGKEERHSQSKTELVFLYDPLLLYKIDGHPSQFIRFREGSVICNEIRPVEADGETLSFFNNSSQSIFPDRILNSIVVWGSPDIHLRARMQVIREMVGQDERGGRIREALRKQISSYRQTLKNGFYRGLPVFKDGIQYYYECEDPKSLQLGFKMGPLRAVQRRLDILTVQTWQGSIANLTEENIYNLPTNTCDRIDFFLSLKLLDEGFASQLKEAYLWFLREYHRAQELYKNSDRRQVIRLPYKKEDFDNYGEIVYQFSLLQEKKFRF